MIERFDQHPQARANGDVLSVDEELGFVPFDAILHASGEYLQHISYRSDPNNPDTDGDGYIDSLDNNPLIVITAEEIMLMEFCSNAEFHELEFLFGGPSGQNKGFLKWYPNIIDRVRLIEIFRKHAYSPDRVAYYKDLQDAGFMGELEPNFWGQVIHHGADLMLANYELSEGGLSLAQLTWLGYESWTNDIKMAASIWLFGISDRYCRQMATWDYTYEYKLSLQQERTIEQYCEFKNRYANLDTTNEYGINPTRLKMTDTVQKHYTELHSHCTEIKIGTEGSQTIYQFGKTTRPYLGDGYTFIINEIMESGIPVADPQGVSGAFLWKVPGTVNGTQGVWELVVKTDTNTILHFLFNSH